MVECGDTTETTFKVQQVFTKMLNEFLNNSFQVEMVDNSGSEMILILNQKPEEKKTDEEVKE